MINNYAIMAVILIASICFESWAVHSAVNAVLDESKVKHTNPIINVDNKDIYYSSVMAGHDLNIDPSSILKCCKGIYKRAGGYSWKYIYDYTTNRKVVIPGAITLGIITEEEVLMKLNIIKGE